MNKTPDTPWQILIADDMYRGILSRQEPLAIEGVVRHDERIVVAMGLDDKAGVPALLASATTLPGLAEDQVGIRFEQDGKAWVAVSGSGEEPARVLNFADSQRFARVEAILDVPRLRSTAVLMIGCGAVGSEMARQLAAAGVGRFFLADRDFLLPVNLPRHACDSRDLGRRKVDAVRDLIHFRNPAAQIEVFHGDITNEGYTWLTGAARQADLLIATTDSSAAQFLANWVACDSAKPLLAAGAWERAFGGEIFWYLPKGSALAEKFGQTSCYQCVFGKVRSVEETPRRREDAPCVVLEPGEPGVGIDLLFPTQVALGVALALMDPDSTRSAIIQGKPNLIYCHSGKTNEWPDALAGPFAVEHKFEEAKFDPICPVCGPE